MIAFAIASLALLVIPGPAVLYVINRSIADGRSIALAGVAGLELGNFVHVIAATIGLSAVIAASATAFGIVKWIGANIDQKTASHGSAINLTDARKKFHSRNNRQYVQPQGRIVFSLIPSTIH